MNLDTSSSPGCAVLADERDRDRATTSDAALIAYQRKWEIKLARLQRAHRQRWRVPGLSEEEVRDALTLRLIEAIRELPEVRPEHCRPGKEWGLCVALAELSVLRRRFRLGATPTDFEDAPVAQRTPSQEERWLELEADGCRVHAAERARRQLNQPQRRWLEALNLAASDGQFFQTSDRLNLSAASRQLGKNRSSAQRAYHALQSCFQRELERIE
jgi:hypothetical protein